MDPDTYIQYVGFIPIRTYSYIPADIMYHIYMSVDSRTDVSTHLLQTNAMSHIFLFFWVTVAMPYFLLSEAISGPLARELLLVSQYLPRPPGQLSLVAWLRCST